VKAVAKSTHPVGKGNKIAILSNFNPSTLKQHDSNCAQKAGVAKRCYNKAAIELSMQASIVYL